jgi:hypothetical protein
MYVLAKGLGYRISIKNGTTVADFSESTVRRPLGHLALMLGHE